LKTTNNLEVFGTIWWQFLYCDESP